MLINSGDTAWMLTSTALVLMMTLPGLALFYAGLVRHKNVLATAMQTFATTCVVTVLWVIVGYSLAFTNGGTLGTWIGDFSRLLFRGADLNNAFVLGAGSASPSTTTIPESVFMMFQMTFAIITPALIAGAFADRMKFSALLLFMGAWSLVVYAPIAHWVWHPNGFLATAGVLDFAGGTVVHISAGVAGLVTALVMGPRLGHPLDQARPYSVLQSLIGASLLWVGWFGFNAGSALAAGGRAGMAMAATMTAAGAAGLAWMGVEWFRRGKPTVTGILSGSVAGLVAITPAAGFVDLEGALAMGALGGALCYVSCTAVKDFFRYDDALDCFGIHGVAGILGAILTGVFATSAVTGGSDPLGWVDGHSAQILVQLKGIGITIAWSVVATWVLLTAVHALAGGLRVSAEVEEQGLDHALHGEGLGAHEVHVPYAPPLSPEAPLETLGTEDQPAKA